MVNRTFLILGWTFALCSMSCFGWTQYGKSNFNYNSARVQFRLAVEGGATFPATDVQKPELGYVFGIGGWIAPLSSLHIGLGLQKGVLTEGRSGGNYHFMNYKNSYFAPVLIGRLVPIGFFANMTEAAQDYLAFYVGSGVALMLSDVDARKQSNPIYGHIDGYKGADVLIPLELGYSLPIAKLSGNTSRLLLNLNARANLSFSDKLDGYVPNLKANKKNDFFAQFTGGLIYSL